MIHLFSNMKIKFKNKMSDYDIDILDDIPYFKDQLDFSEEDDVLVSPRKKKTFDKLLDFLEGDSKLSVNIFMDLDFYCCDEVINGLMGDDEVKHEIGKLLKTYYACSKDPVAVSIYKRYKMYNMGTCNPFNHAHGGIGAMRQLSANTGLLIPPNEQKYRATERIIHEPTIMGNTGNTGNIGNASDQNTTHSFAVARNGDLVGVYCLLLERTLLFQSMI
jgi:hypothetical protein